MKKKWDQKEKDILKKYYRMTDKKELEKLLPQRSWPSIKQCAQKLKIKRSYDVVRTTNVKRLLEETPISYYWIGFLMADGHFETKKIMLGLSIKDLNHIKNFAKFISSKVHKKETSCFVAAANSDIVPIIKEKFNIYSDKTHNPCDLTKIKNDNLLLSLIIGFIDGDGSIRKQHKRQDAFITIKCHSSWLINLQYISDFICRCCGLKSNIARIEKDGYAIVNFSNSILLKFLKEKSKDLNLPVLKRKWASINENHTSKFEAYKYILETVKELVQQGVKKSEIARIINRSSASVYQMVKKHRIKESINEG